MPSDSDMSCLLKKFIYLIVRKRLFILILLMIQTTEYLLINKKYFRNKNAKLKNKAV